MKKTITQLAKKLFGAEVEFRVKLFNAIALLGALTCPIAAHNNYVIGAIFGAALLSFMFALCVALLWYVTKSGNYLLGNICVLVMLGFVMAPGLFFTMGGIETGQQINFIFSIMVTVCLLRGKLMIAFNALQIAVLTACVLIAFYYPETVMPIADESKAMLEVVGNLILVTGTLVALFALHFRIYDRDRRELIAARDRIAELSRLHHGVFTQMSHEMRTPLTVMSASAQYAVKQIERGTMDVNTVSDLKSISGEAKRLAELADNALNALAGGSGKDDSQIVLTSVDIVSLCQNVITLMSHIPQSQRPNITLDAGENIGEVQGDNRLLTQLVYNFLANAATHSGCTEIVVRVRKDNAEFGMRNAELTSTSTSKEKSLGGYVEIAVEDNGKGISPELLPRVFESGVSGEGSTGMGLHLCQEIAEKHGAKISADSEVGKGTRMSVRLRG